MKSSQKLKKTFLEVSETYLNAVQRPSKEEYDEIRESIRLRGQQVPIICNSKGIILDGHTRYEICEMYGLLPVYIIKDFATEEEEMQFVIECNLNRRQLNPFQKIEAYSKLLKYYQQRSEANKRASLLGEKIPYSQGGTAEQFSKSIGMGSRRVQDALFLIKHGRPELLESLRNGVVTINQAKKKLLILPKEKKERFEKQGKRVVKCPKCFHIMNRKDLIKVNLT